MINEETMDFPDTEPKDFLVLERPEQKESLNHPIRSKIIQAMHQGFESFSTEVTKTQKKLDDGTLITEEVTIKRPIRRYWLTAQEILQVLKENSPDTKVSIYKCYYHLRILVEQDIAEQFPPPQDDDGSTPKRVRGMYFRATAKLFVQSKIDLAMRSSNLAPWDWIHGTPGRGFSESYAEMLGYELEELNKLPRGWEGLIHPEDVKHVLAEWENHLKGNIPIFSSEHRLRTKNGQFIWVLDRGRVVEFDEDQKPVRAAGTIQDITNEKIVMEALDRSEERYRRLFNESIQAIGILIDGRIALANQAYADIVGRNLSSLLKMSADEVWEMIHPDDRTHLEERSKQIAKTRTLPRYRFRYVRPSGEIRWVESYVRAVEHDGRDALQTLDIDITEQMKIEQALLESEKSFRGIFEDSPTGILVFGMHGRIIQMNKAAKEILGVQSAEDYRDYTTLKDPNLPEWVLNDMTDGDVINFECLYDIAKAGFKTSKTAPIHLQVRGTVIDTTEDGTVSKYLAHIEDISDRVKTLAILEASEVRYRNLIESRAQPTVILQGSPLRIVYANPAIANVSGYSIMELFALGEKWATAMFHPRSLEGSVDVITDIAMGKLEPYKLGYEDEFVHKDGHSYWLRSHPSLITYNNQPALEVLLIDITEEKELEFALQGTDEEYILYFSHTKIPILLLRDAEIIKCNTAALRLFGYKASEITKKMIWQISPRYQHPKKTSKQSAQDIIRNSFLRRHQVARWKFHKCDGSTIISHIRMNPIEYNNEALVQVRITPYHS